MAAGYDGVSAADLTKAIDIAAPSLYHASGSKAELCRDVLRPDGANGMSADEIASACWTPPTVPAYGRAAGFDSKVVFEEGGRAFARIAGSPGIANYF